MRERVGRLVEAGRSRRAAAAHFGVSVSFVVLLMRHHRATGSLAPRPSGGRRHSKLDPDRAFLLGRVAEKDDITMPELMAKGRCHRRRCRSRLDLPLVDQERLQLQKLQSAEQDCPDIARPAGVADQAPAADADRAAQVFIDETGTTTKMTRQRGRFEKGRRLRLKAPFGRWKTQTFIARLRCHGLTAPFVVDAPMNRRIFET